MQDHASHGVSEHQYIRFFTSLFQHICVPVGDESSYSSAVLKADLSGKPYHTFGLVVKCSKGRQTDCTLAGQMQRRSVILSSVSRGLVFLPSTSWGD